MVGQVEVHYKTNGSGINEYNNIDQTRTVLQPLHRSTRVSQHPHS